MRVKRHYKPLNMRGTGHNKCCVMYTQHGNSIIGTVLKGGLRLAKKYVTLNNLKSMGRHVLKQITNEGKRLIKDNKDVAIASASEFAAKQTKKMFDDIKKGNTVKQVVEEQKKAIKKEAKAAGNKTKSTLKKSAQNVVSSSITPQNQLLLSNILAGNGIAPPKKRGRPRKSVGGQGPKKGLQKGAGIQLV